MELLETLNDSEIGKLVTHMDKKEIKAVEALQEASALKTLDEAAAGPAQNHPNWCGDGSHSGICT